MDDTERKLSQLADDVATLRRRFDTLERGCVTTHSALNRRVEEFEEGLTDADRAIDLLKAELHEHGAALKSQGETLKWVKDWVERWGAETVSLGRHLEKLDERQGLTSQTTQAILDKLIAVMDIVNEVASNTRRAG